MRPSLPALLILSAPPALACAQPQSQPDVQEILSTQDTAWGLTDLRLRDATIYWENDGTVPNLVDDTDRFYTNGVGLEFSFDPNFTPEIAQMLAPSDEWGPGARFGLGLALKQHIYTSEFITDRDPPADDHPYSGYLYLAFSLQRADDEKHDHFELDVGVVGERSQAEAVQRIVHKSFPDEDDPQGWGTQHANELTLNFTYERTWKSSPAELSGIQIQMLPMLGFDVGNVSTRAKAKLTLRAGLGLPDDFGPASFLGHKDHTVGNADWGQGDWSFYMHAGLQIDAVAHSIFLDGNTFADSRSVDSELLVATASVGAVLRYKQVYLGWTQHFQTETFEAQPDQQTWGAIVLGASFRY